jgi:hypothetical protein
MDDQVVRGRIFTGFEERLSWGRHAVRVYNFGSMREE